MKEFERKVYSQAGQDGVIEHIFSVIGTANGYFVEFGAGDGVHLSNTANLRINKRWTGLLMDSKPGSPFIDEVTVTAENVQQLFHVNKVPCSFDYLSIDVDGNDYWVWKAIKRYHPRLVSVEFNSNFAGDISVTVPYVPNRVWNGTSYFGASLGALHKLGLKKGYSLVHIVENLDAFFVRDDCLKWLATKTPMQLLPEPIPCFEKYHNATWITV